MSDVFRLPTIESSTRTLGPLDPFVQLFTGPICTPVHWTHLYTCSLDPFVHLFTGPICTTVYWTIHFWCYNSFSSLAISYITNTNLFCLFYGRLEICIKQITPEIQNIKVYIYRVHNQKLKHQVRMRNT